MIHLLIPARSKSKSIKNKNIIKINNKELIYYTIKTAKKIRKISKLVVSTDSKKIALIAKKYGAEIPFLRPEKISKDSSTDLELFKHYINWLKKKKFQIPNLIVHLRVTSPFRSHVIINKAVSIMLKYKKFSSLRCFRRSCFSPNKMWYINKNKCEPVLKTKKEWTR